MYLVFAVVIGGLYAAGLYLLLQRSVVRIIFGLILLSHAANLLIFTASGITRNIPPLVPQGASMAAAGHADPVPQALVLTAIVIGFAVLAFAAVLVERACDTVGTDDVDEMRSTDS